MSEKKKRGLNDYDPLNMQRASMLRMAMQEDLVTLIHAKNKHGEEVDVLCIKDESRGSLFPIAMMLDSIDDIQAPPGIISIGNPRLN